MTTKPCPADRKNDLAKIHIGSAALKWIDGSDKSEYQRHLWTICRAESAADLDHAGRQKFLDYLKSCGWKPVFKRKRTARQKNRGNATPDQVKLIVHIWGSLYRGGVVRDKGDAALRNWIRAWTRRSHPQGTGYDAPELLPYDIAQRIIEQLKKWAGRTNVDWR